MQKGVASLIVILAFVATILGVLYFYGRVLNPPQKALPVTVNPTTASPKTDNFTIPDSTETVDKYGIATYTSKTLGITFRYTKEQGGKVIEKDNKICLNSQNAVDCEGQWVQVFTKSSGDSLEDAIKTQILKGYAEKDCYVEVRTSEKEKNEFVLKTAVIAYPQSTDPEDPFANAEKCPKDYTASNGIAYFAEYRTNPDKYLFFSIGQYAITAEDDTAWQYTLRFI